MKKETDYYFRLKKKTDNVDKKYNKRKNVRYLHMDLHFKINQNLKMTNNLPKFVLLMINRELKTNPRTKF